MAAPQCTATATGVHRSAAARDACPRCTTSGLKGTGRPRTEVQWRTQRALPLDREDMAARHDAASDVLDVLADDSLTGVRRQVAMNPNTPARTLHRLADDPSDAVKQNALARIRMWMNSNLGVDTANHEAFEMLRQHDWWNLMPDDDTVVLALATYPNS